jgi:hypothetical protein
VWLNDQRLASRHGDLCRSERYGVPREMYMHNVGFCDSSFQHRVHTDAVKTGESRRTRYVPHVNE